MVPRKKQQFEEEALPKVRDQFSIRNPMAAPRLEKIVLNGGLGDRLEGNRLPHEARQQVMHDFAVITGQTPVMRRARKSVAGFRVREGTETHVMVTLRRARMWEFFDRLVTAAIPRIKDFRGLSPKSFDGRGNYNFGIAEQGVFPEVNMAEARFTHGMNITLTFRNSDNEKSDFLLREMGFPLAEAP
jgi:large subunit ribosomal protein L5